jgi:sulfatase maturation enzyme AslB (radical SAM superfamily)
MKKINKIIFVLTSECLHKCRYCFDRDNYPRETINYTAEDIKAFLDINREHLDSPLEIILQGGDLTLAKHFDEIVEMLIHYPHHLTFRFYFATLPIKMFYKYPIFMISHLGVSMDGPRHVHNLNRKRTDGKNSFDEIEYLLYMNSMSNILFMCVISSNTVHFFDETYAFFEKHGAKVSYLVDRREPYWTSESIEKLKQIKVAVWGADESMFLDNELERNRIMVFANGQITLFAREFVPSHQLVTLGWINQREFIGDKFQEEVQKITLCGHSCAKCSHPCEKQSRISGVITPTIPMINFIYPTEHVGFFDPVSMREVTLKEKCFDLISFDKQLKNDLFIGGVTE